MFKKKKKKEKDCGCGKHKHGEQGCSKLAYQINHIPLVNGGWLFVVVDVQGGGQTIDAVKHPDFKEGHAQAKAILDEHDIRKIVHGVT